MCSCNEGYSGTKCDNCDDSFFLSPTGLCERRVVEQNDTIAAVWVPSTCLAALIALSCAALALFFWRNRSSYAIKASSPFICKNQIGVISLHCTLTCFTPHIHTHTHAPRTGIFMCSCGVLASASSVLLVLPVSMLPGICVLRVWTLNLATTGLAAAVFTRTYRLDRLFNNSTLRKIVISDAFLWKVIAVMVAGMVLVLVAWTVFDMPTTEVVVEQVRAKVTRV